MQIEHADVRVIAHCTDAIAIPVANHRSSGVNIPDEIDVAKRDAAWLAVIREVPSLICGAINADAIVAIPIKIATKALITGVAEDGKIITEPGYQRILLIEDAIAISVDAYAVMGCSNSPFTRERTIAGIAKNKTVACSWRGVRVTQKIDARTAAIDTNRINTVAVPVARHRQVRGIAAKSCRNISSPGAVAVTQVEDAILIHPNSVETRYWSVGSGERCR